MSASAGHVEDFPSGAASVVGGSGGVGRTVCLALARAAYVTCQRSSVSGGYGL